MIIQSIRAVMKPKTDLIFTAAAVDDVVLAHWSISRITKLLSGCKHWRKNGKSFYHRLGMLGQPGVAAQMFDILSQKASILKSFLLLKLVFLALLLKDRVKDAVRVIHNGLLLDQEVSQSMDSPT